ncbi:hypothetical protein ACLOJK_021210 [Asimina triloba]
MAKTLSVKLLVDGESQKVVFAECGKDFIDFLFSFFMLPLGSVAEVLSKDSVVADVAAIGQLYKSVKDMDEAYLLPGKEKVAVLQPKVFSPTNKHLLLQIGNLGMKRRYYACCNIGNSGYGRCNYVTDVANAKCPDCKNHLSKELPYLATCNDPAASTSKEEGGFVKSMVIYMVTDDLNVTPVSPISAITLLNKFNIKEVGALEEKVVEVGKAEGLALLKASLQSQTVLTDVFLSKSTQQSHKESRVFNSNMDELHLSFHLFPSSHAIIKDKNETLLPGSIPTTEDKVEVDHS